MIFIITSSSSRCNMFFIFITLPVSLTFNLKNIIRHKNTIINPKKAPTVKNDSKVITLKKISKPKVITPKIITSKITTPKIITTKNTISKVTPKIMTSIVKKAPTVIKKDRKIKDKIIPVKKDNKVINTPTAIPNAKVIPKIPTFDRLFNETEEINKILKTLENKEVKIIPADEHENNEYDFVIDKN